MPIPLADDVFSTFELTFKVKKTDTQRQASGIRRPTGPGTPLNFAANTVIVGQESHTCRAAVVPRKLRPTWRERSPHRSQDARRTNPDNSANRTI